MTFTPTPEQQRIIDYDPVHLRVAAGAGTGKTTTIVERLGQFVAAGISPTRALGITFTVKASDELRTRLRERVGGAGMGDEVEVTTYHGFAASILDEFGPLIGYDNDAMLLDDGHRSELGQLVLRNLPTTLDLTAMKQRVDDVLELNDSLDRHLRDPDDLVAFGPPPDSADPDGPWPVRYELVRAVAAYRAEKRRLGLVEFADLIRKSVEIVTTIPEVAHELAGRYDVVLLDEYQDTDPAQRILLTTIFGPSAAVTAVGDTDQTIYEWRGASLDNFEAFPDHFPRSDGFATETLPLSLNRRSDAMILTLANRIREELPSIDGSEPLTPGPDAKDGSVMVSWHRSERDEAWAVARDIAKRHGEGLPWSEMAVLVRKRAWIPLLVAALHHHDIPTSVSDPGTLLQIPEVADVLAWLRIVADPDAENALLRILMGGQYRLGIADLNLLRIHARRIDATTLLGAMTDLDRVDGLDTPTRSALERFNGLHRELMQFAQVNSVSNTINRIITTIGFWDEAAALRAGEATTARLNIGRFLNIANGWRPIEGRATVRRFLRYIDALNESGRDEALTPPVRSTADAVELTTIHGAKGLEWDAVYIPGLQDRDFPMGSRKHDDPDSHATVLPYELRLDFDSLQPVAEAIGDRRKDLLKLRDRLSEYRLAYVGVTRARHALMLSGHAWHDSVKNPKKPSEFLSIARELDGVTVGTWIDDPGYKPDLMSFSIDGRDKDPLFTRGVEHALRATIDDAGWVETNHPDAAGEVAERVAQLSLEIGELRQPVSESREPPFATAVTNLVALAECPLKFKWIHYDKMPRRPSKAASDGTEFHRKVELHNLGKVPLDDAAPDRYDAILADAEIDQFETAGSRSDPWTVFENSRFASTKSRFTEVPFEVAVGVGSIRGKIDAIYEPEPGRWEIVDYKSGRVSENPARRVQLQAYAIAAVDGAVSIDRPESMRVAFAYFGDAEVVEVIEDVDDDWLDEARSDIERLVAVGAEGPWEPKPSPSCVHCDFMVHCPAGRAWVRENGRS